MIWKWALVIVTLCCAMRAMAGGGACTELGRAHQVPMKGPLRSGYFRVIELPSSGAAECWLAEAGEALLAGRYERARSAYAKVLRSRPDDLEALLGLAAVAIREGDHEQARRYYLKVLVQDPRNTTALVGMSVVAGDDPKVAAALEQLVRERPDLAQVHFALGNLYVRKEDWSKAQFAYFQAWRHDKENPDYLYNLAVSLDHLGKRSLARRFYERALQMSQLHSHAFDPSMVEGRLRQLSGAGS